VPPNFWTTTKSRSYTERLGLPRGSRESPISIVVFLRDQAIVAARPADDFVMLPVKFVCFRALAIEGRDRFFVLAR
jgi:hypothetical protein